MYRVIYYRKRRGQPAGGKVGVGSEHEVGTVRANVILRIQTLYVVVHAHAIQDV